MDSLARVLDVDPDLGQGLDPGAFELARTKLVAGTLDVVRGLWDADALWVELPVGLGLLILAGVLARDIIVGRRASLEILGAGDLVRPWPSDGQADAFRVDLRFNALAPVRFAVLDEGFAERAARWPSILSEITGRAMGRTTGASLRLLVNQVVRIDDRVLLSLWGLSERFGRVTPNGVLLPLPINHTMMARFVGAQRPTVSHAVGELTRRGDVERLPDGGWLLKGTFPAHLFGTPAER